MTDKPLSLSLIVWDDSFCTLSPILADLKKNNDHPNWCELTRSHHLSKEPKTIQLIGAQSRIVVAQQ